MPRRTLARLAMLALMTSGALTTGAASAPLVHADTEESVVVASMPAKSQAGWKVAAWTVPYGRKLR